MRPGAERWSVGGTERVGRSRLDVHAAIVQSIERAIVARGAGVNVGQG